MMKTYSITKENCQIMIDTHKTVCCSCGGQLTPIETEDNSGTPTFWAGCQICQVFDWGCSPEVFKISQDMVLNQNYWIYNHMGPPYKLEGLKLKMWQESQIRGTTGLVRQVLSTLKKITDEPNL